MCSSGSSQLKAAIEKFNDVLIVTESLGSANISPKAQMLHCFH
jgi:hypothetical protein